MKKGDKVKWNGNEMDVQSVSEDGKRSACSLARADGCVFHNVPVGEVTSETPAKKGK